MRPYSRLRVMSDRIGSFKDQATSPPPHPAPSYPAPWAYYPLSANENDASGNGRNLTGDEVSYMGTGGVVSGYAYGDIILTTEGSSSPSTWSMCGWFKPATQNFLDVVYGILYWDNVSAIVSSYTQSYIDIPGLVQVVDDSVWLHLSVTKSGATPQGYFNGTAASQGSPATYNGAAFEVYSTRLPESSIGICEVAIWNNTVLTALEIAAVFSQGDAGLPLV